MGFSFRNNFITIILSVIVVLMGIEILYLIRQNRRLLKIINNPIPANQMLQPGTPVPPFRAPELKGDTIFVEYSDGQPYRLLLWLSTSCPACEDNLGFWNDLFIDLESEQISVIGVGTDEPAELSEMAASNGLLFPVVNIDDPAIIQAYKGFSRPQTILIDPQGRVRNLWPGSLSREQRESLTAELTKVRTLTGKGGDF